jgi:hypothetical protein
MTKKAVVKAEEPQAPATHAGPTGLSSNITAQDLRLPRVALLQSLSPQVQNQGEKYKQGMFIDTLTQDILDTPVTFVPIFVFKNIIKWKPRSEGGGMLWKTLTPTAEQLKDTQWDGTNKPSADVYINCVCIVNNSPTPLIISFCKTSLKAGQDLATLITLSGQAWKHQYILESVKTTNSKGIFYVMRVKRGGLATADQVVEAATLYESVKNLAIETDYEGATHETSPSTGEPAEF